MQTYAYGFPRLGKNREFKKHIENFWEGRISDEELISSLDVLEQQRLEFYSEYVDTFVLGEFTYYDNVFDNAFIFGIYKFKNLDDYFEYARGKKPLELKKYFNTNYHYLVPVVSKNTKFNLSWNKPLFYFKTFFSFKDDPVFLIGPYTFLKLCRLEGNLNFEKAFVALTKVYCELFKELEDEGVGSIHIEEPAFCLDVTTREIELIKKAYKKILPFSFKTNLITYYESVDFLKSLYDLPFDSIGLDFVAGGETLKNIKKIGFPKDKKLICGIVNGRSVQRSNILNKAKLVETIQKHGRIPQENILISNSCPLYHLPVTLENEGKLDSGIKSKISFAKERLYELGLIKKVLEGKKSKAQSWSKGIGESVPKSSRKIFSTLSLSDSKFRKRKKLQQESLNLPLFPITTIGSFPQDKGLRKLRRDFREKKVSIGEYDGFIREKIFNLIERQENIGLDVLVHGEFERSDMVEFFAQQLKGFLTTENGWIISYGSRVYRPPIVYGKIKRNRSLSLKEIFYAENLTPKIVKGILTGPVTILAWSYNLRNEPIHEVAFELAAVLNAEARDVVKKGIKLIQIDEPAIKEFAPLKKRNRDFYFSWAVRSFNLAACLPQHIQVHTHLCYSEFGQIVKWIMKMNFDVITIEAARDKAKIIDSFKNAKFNRAIGPGVWDIHSKYPAQIKTIKEILDKSIKAFGVENVWLNPDCGLKTRDFSETEVSLRRIVKVAKEYRKKYASGKLT